MNWQDKEKADKEEREVLIPLSKERAEKIKQALVQKGIDGRRITTIGHGSFKPLVPFSDKDNQWKNCRVEIILRK